MIIYVTHARVLAENAGAYAAIIDEMIANVRAHEPGVIHYSFGRSDEDPELWMVVEVYRDEAAIADHWKTDYIRPLLERATPLVEAGSFETKRYDGP
jgi:quinol monooxygenase YgiN